MSTDSDPEYCNDLLYDQNKPSPSETPDLQCLMSGDSDVNAASITLTVSEQSPAIATDGEVSFNVPTRNNNTKKTHAQQFFYLLQQIEDAPPIYLFQEEEEEEEQQQQPHDGVGEDGDNLPPNYLYEEESNSEVDTDIVSP